MATRRPLVRVNGRIRQLPAGDVLAGGELRLPVFLTEVALVLVDLNVRPKGGALPVYQSNGEMVEVPL